uniref:Uncharacterized protein n=1 Tax=Caenorhabditis japonica TaxID=281687 RepID=A0A8R1ENQ1_CAEJA
MNIKSQRNGRLFGTFASVDNGHKVSVGGVGGWGIGIVLRSTSYK